MFSKEESAQLRKEFWVSFGKSFPKKWLLYKTGVKTISFKFVFDTKQAQVVLDFEGNEREIYYEKMVQLRTIFTQDFLPEAVFEPHFFLENGKEISRVYVKKTGVSIHNKNSWQQVMLFFVENMQKMEDFWAEYEDFFKE